MHGFEVADCGGFFYFVPFSICLNWMHISNALVPRAPPIGSKLSKNVAPKASRRGRRRCWKMMKMMKYSIFSTYSWFAIPGALSDSGPQDLSLSGLSSQLWDLGLSERAWQKFHRGRGVPCRKTKFF